ncbi:hypothetical protein B0H10DRAFT_891350 [Mycena sp. CBHHK59/15]|nr:hypothetical protein B0H10DRAFT_891350 [Mycena sp. CBHHK59/15]
MLLQRQWHYTKCPPPKKKNELEERLNADFPYLFADGCSCDIGDSWEPLLRRLCVDLKPKTKLRFIYIKEKFGGLRAYISHSGDRKISDRILYHFDQRFR